MTGHEQFSDGFSGENWFGLNLGAHWSSWWNTNTGLSTRTQLCQRSLRAGGQAHQESTTDVIFLSLATQGSPSPWFLSVPGEMLFVLLIVSSGGHNSVVKHWYFSVPPFWCWCSYMFTVLALGSFFLPFVSKLLPLHNICWCPRGSESQGAASLRWNVSNQTALKHLGSEWVLHNLWVQK